MGCHSELDRRRRLGWPSEIGNQSMARFSQARSADSRTDRYYLAAAIGDAASGRRGRVRPCVANHRLIAEPYALLLPAAPNEAIASIFGHPP